jgi:hypothetical protein
MLHLSRRVAGMDAQRLLIETVPVPSWASACRGEAAARIRRVLSHPELATAFQRMSAVMRVSATALVVWCFRAEREALNAACVTGSWLG